MALLRFLGFFTVWLVGATAATVIGTAAGGLFVLLGCLLFGRFCLLALGRLVVSGLVAAVLPGRFFSFSGRFLRRHFLGYSRTGALAAARARTLN